MTSINVFGREPDAVLDGMINRCERVERVRSLGELRTLLEGWPAPLAGPVALDLIGHSTRGARLLRLGETVIDMFDPSVRELVESIARDRLLERLGIGAVRLLGCNTASSPVGRRTMARIARTLAVPVFGSTKSLRKSHFGPAGFRPEFSRCLVEAAHWTA